MNSNRLVKLLNLTNSDNDLEALRTANKMLAKNNLSWEDLFKKRESDDSTSSNYTQDSRVDSDEVESPSPESMLYYPYNFKELSEWEADFIDDVRVKHRKNNQLSKKQIISIARIFKSYS